VKRPRSHTLVVSIPLWGAGIGRAHALPHPARHGDWLSPRQLDLLRGHVGNVQRGDRVDVHYSGFLPHRVGALGTRVSHAKINSGPSGRHSLHGFIRISACFAATATCLICCPREMSACERGADLLSGAAPTRLRSISTFQLFDSLPKQFALFVALRQAVLQSNRFQCLDCRDACG
jgi:hypothetical protein